MIIVCSFSLSYFGISQVNAAFNKQMNYQGKLTTPLGIAVADGDYNMEFVLYNHPTLGGANILWTETRTGGDKVSVTNGLFSVMLGEVTSLTGVDFDQTVYLGVNIGGTGAPSWDGEMTPRKKLGAVPAAIVAEYAGTVATNANLTGAITSVGNATSLGSFTTVALNTALNDNDVATLAGTEALTNKTLTAPKFADGGFIADASGLEMLIFDSNALAVNQLTISNSATGAGLTLAATGDDANVAFSIDAKGTGLINVGNTSTGSILFAGGAGSTGCTITTAGALTCDGAASFSNLSGTNTGDQTFVTGNAGTVTFADAGGDTTTFVALGTDATGSLSPRTDAGLTYNATTDILTATGFAGPLTGNVTGNVTGNAATVTTNANLTGAITSVGNATSLGSFSTASLNTALNDNDVATLAGSETLTNKTLTAPKFADLGFIADTAGLEMLIFDSVTSAVNELTIGNAATGTGVFLKATGGDTNINLSLLAKGTGTINADTATTATTFNVGNSTSSSTTSTFTQLGKSVGGAALSASWVLGTAGYVNLNSQAVSNIITYSTTSGYVALGTATATLAPLQIGTANVENSTDSVILITRDVDDTRDVTGVSEVGNNGHAFSDSSQISRTGGMAYNSFDGRTNFSGTANYDHYAAFQSAPTYASSGTILNYYGLYSSWAANAGTTTNAYRVYGADASGAGAVTNNYGVYIASLTKGGTSNYAVYTAGTTDSHFGGDIDIGGTLQVTGNASGASGTSALKIINSSAASASGQEVVRLDATHTSATVGSGAMLSFNGGATQFGSIRSYTEASSKIGMSFSTFSTTLGERMRISAAGNVGIGETTPTAVLHLKAGTTAASSAPLKFTSGSLNTTAEAGAVEFLTDAYYGTITTGAARKTFAFLESPTFTTPNIGVATGSSGTVLATQTFTTNNIADSGALTIKSATSNALTLDSGTTGIVNLGTSNNAKTINVGTGTAGNAINIGTNNTTLDTINIGSALDDVAITGDQWSITNAGVLTVVSCTGCGAAPGYVTLTGIETLTNKTLTSPKFADLDFIADPAGNELLIFDSVASAVNEITIKNAITANGVSLAATGGDTNIDLTLGAKAGGILNLDTTGTATTVYIGNQTNNTTSSTLSQRGKSGGGTALSASWVLTATGFYALATQAVSNYLVFNTTAQTAGMGDGSPDYSFELHDATNTPNLALSDDDVAHGVTTLADTDVFLRLTTISSTVGGAQITALADADGIALGLKGVQSSNPTDTTPAISLVGAKASGTGVQDLAAAETVLQVLNNATSLFTVLGNGTIGIGDSAPTTAKLVITQTDAANLPGIYINTEESTDAQSVFSIESDTTNGSGADTLKFKINANGDVFSEGTQYGGPADLAEMYYIEGTLEPGDVVTATQASNEDGFGVKKAQPGDTIMGVISTKPGLVLGMDWKNPVKTSQQKPVALVGRVPVKISEENGKVLVGDRITASMTIPGTAMKMTESGTSIGIALESSEDKEAVMVFVNLAYHRVNTNNDISIPGVDEGTSEAFGSYAVSFFQNVVQKVEGGMVYLRGLAVEKLKVGSPEKRTGITLFDEVTGEPYCISIKNGDAKTTAGECPVIRPQEPESIPEPEVTLEPIIPDSPPEEPSPEPQSEPENPPAENPPEGGGEQAPL